MINQSISNRFTHISGLGLCSLALSSLAGSASAEGAGIYVNNVDSVSHSNRADSACTVGRDLWSRMYGGVYGRAVHDGQSRVDFSSGHFTILFGNSVNQGSWQSFLRFSRRSNRVGEYQRWVNGDFLGTTAGSPLRSYGWFLQIPNGAQNLQTSFTYGSSETEAISLFGYYCELTVQPRTRHDGLIYASGSGDSVELSGHVESDADFVVSLDTPGWTNGDYESGELGRARTTGNLHARSIGSSDPDCPNDDCVAISGDVDARFTATDMHIGTRDYYDCSWLPFSAGCARYANYIDDSEEAEVVDL